MSKTDGAFEVRATPNPATPAAKALGCICPKQDGRGHRVRMACPVHGMQAPLRDRNSAERKAEPVHSGVMLYFPDALAAVARISKAGNDKHNPGEPLHWARGKSTDHMDCLARHALTPAAIDPDSGEYEQAQVVWRGLAKLQLMEEERLAKAGIRPYSGIVP